MSFPVVVSISVIKRADLRVSGLVSEQLESFNRSCSRSLYGKNKHSDSSAAHDYYAAAIRR